MGSERTRDMIANASGNALALEQIAYRLESQLAASQERVRELEGERCECGAKVTDYPHGCPTCGAPQCCQACCKVDAANARAETAERERDEALRERDALLEGRDDGK